MNLLKFPKRNFSSDPIKYCGVFTPCKNCNIETRSRDYATVDEAVFSPCRTEQSRAESRSYKHLDNARVGKGHVRSRASSDATIKAFSLMSDQGFIGVRSRSYRRVLDGRQPWKVHS
jgi:hypothetical protein